MIFRKDKEALRRLDGRCVTVYQGVVLTPGPLSCDKSQSSQVDETPWGSMKYHT